MAKKTTHTKKRASKSKSEGMIANLEIYAFWTGFASTLISLAGVLVQVFR